ncbi:MAG: hypothetical protein ACXVA2_12195 [Mucilaginibacter sp.]
MMWILVFLLIIAAVFSYLLFAPFYLEIDSTNSLFRIRFHHLASATLISKNSIFKIDLRIAGWNKQIDLVADLFRKKTKEQSVSPQKKKKSSKLSFRQIKAISKSFKVNECQLSLDTGNVQLNGMLYPGFYWLSRYTGKPIGINFLDKNILIVEIENNFASIIRAFIYSSLKQKDHGKLR